MALLFAKMILCDFWISAGNIRCSRDGRTRFSEAISDSKFSGIFPAEFSGEKGIRCSHWGNGSVTFEFERKQGDQLRNIELWWSLDCCLRYASDKDWGVTSKSTDYRCLYEYRQPWHKHKANIVVDVLSVWFFEMRVKGARPIIAVVIRPISYPYLILL
jgi:hypothetical protein